MHIHIGYKVTLIYIPNLVPYFLFYFLSCLCQQQLPGRSCEIEMLHKVHLVIYVYIIRFVSIVVSWLNLPLLN